MLAELPPPGNAAAATMMEELMRKHWGGCLERSQKLKTDQAFLKQAMESLGYVLNHFHSVTYGEVYSLLRWLGRIISLLLSILHLIQPRAKTA